MRSFRGDCHVHSLKSHGGEMTPAEVVAEARAAGLDFLAVTEHDAPADLADWTGMLVIPGQEVLTPDGHWLSLGSAPDDLRVVAHPFAPYPTGTFRRSFDGFHAIEVWNGRWSSDLPWNADNEAALAAWDHELRQGRRIPAIGNSDTHLPGQIGTPQLVIQAPDLTASAVLTAIRTGACWIAGSADTDLTFTPSSVRVTGVPSGAVTVHTDRGQVLREVLPESGDGVLEWSAGPWPYVRVEVRHPGGHMAALTNPLFR
ncbi:PHP-associated domain-containing protein [Actinoplanes derwentensis]|uniref:PHP-associated n=1 Tax=Actinoplanes derwentensis TaxID=113562 RepID=A0A1H1Z045_9ACTN|nr:PHP-associated domain-containing protein [Actinoplanes derwentensis]GID81363.1 hypothetical protein Ade03nite_02870 [Actinoplanes derwentensis]SDT26967.1 PHP-associated [Actinoplanes derwentensis]